MPKKSVEEQIADLAIMIGGGFAEQQASTLSLRTEMHEGFANVASRLDRIEFHVVGQERRIGILEEKIRQIGTKVGLEFI